MSTIGEQTLLSWEIEKEDSIHLVVHYDNPFTKHDMFVCLSAYMKRVQENSLVHVVLAATAILLMFVCLMR